MCLLQQPELITTKPIYEPALHDFRLMAVGAFCLFSVPVLRLTDYLSNLIHRGCYKTNLIQQCHFLMLAARKVMKTIIYQTLLYQ